MRFLFPHGAIFYADNAEESAVADFRLKITDLSIQRYTMGGGKDVILSRILSIREKLNLYGQPCHVKCRHIKLLTVAHVVQIDNNRICKKVYIECNRLAEARLATSAFALVSLVPRPFPPPVFDRLQYKKRRGRGSL